ncbi:hypothetical protein XSP_002909 [Xanthomonas euroxanthea]|uniref:Secreted protein n=1 Tax=Xanthomonas euroxanthea TaxID=2259622 RepID=A0A8E4ET72_9XANT|nr:hypothetical protein [Xanthomonas euroxanthea]MBB5768314.1 hypothetical protein [Xanthomonas euroxanthea]CAD1794240.1 hypothetical protein XSP_002909 [Xanthomonas euroxanthea]SYZ53575.1 hypothetical protein CPBF367_16510 [Xanthomonas arboricola pv. juglandis]
MPVQRTPHLVAAAALLALSLQVTANAAGAPANRDDVKAYALQLCLDNNYERSGKYTSDQLRDRSYLLTTYALDNAKVGATERLHRFVGEQTADFHRAEVPMKDEARRGPFNRIFAQCMAFYRSPALNEFIAHKL